MANSGTPLLGGLNAGALYPLTVIFAFVPPIAAWVINCIAVYVIAATGMFAPAALARYAHAVLLRRGDELRRTPGAMIGQLRAPRRRPGLRLHPLDRADPAVAVAPALTGPTTTRGATTRGVAKPWIWGYALLWGLDLPHR